ncbi:L-ribulokinase [Dyadobacter jejuensis]|uniref:Ribulokinase n=1 Tax=Dyadobacter jejuensis TaxID=1082580 RepID=A0A316AI64_9BACT|nr:ribulokinase [Dyadobacter jejuensis]PWJ57341.1 L-ribulokinase [Dyadobacter jejuensis]
MKDQYVIGIDYGTDSVRALVINAANGQEEASAVRAYPRWKQQLYCDASKSQFRQHPLDYIECLEGAVVDALGQCDASIAGQIKGISIDTTGSTPVAVDRSGQALAMLPEFADNPNAMFILWKDHTANAEAEEINHLVRNYEIDFTKYVGGIYSSEWFWAKILKTLRSDYRIREKAFSWVEHCDWISAQLTGNTDPLTLRRSRCAAGHKAMWNEEFDGLPSEDFLTKLDPLLSGLRDKLYQDTYTADAAMGTISAEWAQRLGLPADVKIGVGAFDAHMGAVGAMIEPYALCKVIGTSTCDILVAPNDEVGHLLIKGICGQVDGSVLPGMLGMEAGQSAFGDIYAWFAKLILNPVKDLLGSELADEIHDKIIPYLAEKAKALPVTKDDMVAVDWLNGRRTPDANHTLKGSIMGLDLGITSIKIFKSLVESTAFGSKSIVERFDSEGVKIKEVIAIGGVARKSDFVMQILSDVLQVPIKVARADQACALGAAMFASVVAGIHPNVHAAQQAMGTGFDAIYTPREAESKIYQHLYGKYLQAGDFVENVFIANQVV